MPARPSTSTPREQPHNTRFTTRNAKGAQPPPRGSADHAAPAGRGAARSRRRRGSRRRPSPRLRGGARERRNVSRYRGGRARLAWLSGRGGRRPTLSTPCAAAAREGGRADRSLAGCPSAPRPPPWAPSSLKLLFYGCWYWVLVSWLLPWPQEWAPSPLLLVHLERARVSAPQSAPAVPPQ